MFKKYNSLTNHTDKKFLNKILFAGLTDPKVLWVAREKIHGANFSFIVTSDSVSVGKRSGVIPEGENFYSHADIESRYRADVISVRRRLIDLGIATETSEIQIYGELAGVTSTGKLIQHGVDYGPSDFYVFDITVDGVYQDDTTCVLALTRTNITMAPFLKMGTFDELISMRNDFDSVVQRWKNDFNAIVWDKGEHLQYTETNTAEGFVMKPIEVHYVGMERVAIKHKNEKFSEKKNKVKNFKAPVPMTEKDQEVLNELLTFNTENRVRNVLSKTGIPDTKQFGMIMGLTVKDILEESKNILDTADSPATVKKTLIAEVGNLIRPHWVNICNGEF